MLFNEKYAISHVNFNTGRILIDHSTDEELTNIDENFDGLIRGFCRLTGGCREGIGMNRYIVRRAPCEFAFQIDLLDGIVITVENMRKIDETVIYIKTALADINKNMLYQNNEYFTY